MNTKFVYISLYNVCSTPVLRKALEKPKHTYTQECADGQLNMRDLSKKYIKTDTEEYHADTEAVWSGNRFVN